MLSNIQLPATALRVERHTEPELNEAIGAVTDARLAELERADATRIARRLAYLEREWDIERTSQLNAAVIAGTGLLLGAKVDRRFLALPLAVFSFFLQHAIQGWCPPIPVFRQLGVRTAREIARERYALNALRGDFDAWLPAGQVQGAVRVEAALRAVDA